MEKLTNNIAEKISSELGLDNDRKAVIAYGIFALLHSAISIIVIVIFGLLVGELAEVLIVSFTASILRKYSGGVHTSSPGICTATGTIVVGGLTLAISVLYNQQINFKLFVLLGLITFIWSYYIIYKLAPVDSTAKPIKTQMKRERMKKGSIVVLDAYAVIVAINVVLYLSLHNKRFLIFSMCIFGGIIWQSFTLTRAGHLTIQKIDTFLNHIFTNKRRK